MGDRPLPRRLVLRPNRDAFWLAGALAAALLLVATAYGLSALARKQVDAGWGGPQLDELLPLRELPGRPQPRDSLLVAGACLLVAWASSLIVATLVVDPAGRRAITYRGFLLPIGRRVHPLVEATRLVLVTRGRELHRVRAAHQTGGRLYWCILFAESPQGRTRLAWFMNEAAGVPQAERVAAALALPLVRETGSPD